MYLSSQSLRKNERHRNIHHNLHEQTTTHVINTLRIAFSSTETPVYSHTLEDTIEYSSIQIQWMNGEYDFENGKCYILNVTLKRYFEFERKLGSAE